MKRQMLLCLCANTPAQKTKCKSQNYINLHIYFDCTCQACSLLQCESGWPSDVARLVTYMFRLNAHRPHRLVERLSPAPVSSIWGLCMTVTSDMRSPSDRKTPPKALLKDNCESAQHSRFPSFVQPLCPEHVEKWGSPFIFLRRLLHSLIWMNIF